MPDDQVTLGEVQRSLADFRKTVTERFDRMDRRMDGLSYVRIDVYERDLKATNERVQTLSESLQWFRRTVFAAVIVVVVPLAIAAVSLRGG
jgi:hypothetical protein